MRTGGRRKDAPPCGWDSAFALLPELVLVELGVHTALGQQLLVGAALLDALVGQDDDLIGVLDGGQPVGHDEGGAAAGELLQGALDERCV